MTQTVAGVESTPSSATSSSSSSSQRHSELRRLTGDDDDDFDLLQQYKVQALIPLKEDLANWLNSVLGPIGIDAVNFMDVLDSGVVVCKLAAFIEHKAKEACSKDKSILMPPTAPKYRELAERGSWFARDNTTNFINWCRQLGVKTECLFETEQLVLQRDPRSVVLCLLELVRIASRRYGVQPPHLIRLETEIDQEQRRCSLYVDQADDETPREVAMSKQKTQATVERRKSTSLSDYKSFSQLTEEVDRLTRKGDYDIQRLSEGRYKIGDRVVFIRLLNERHLMVRVGGGWDTLEHYLLQHYPYKITEFQRRPGDSSADSFLHIAGRYKVSS